jgi:hypothetical protein
LISWRRIWKKCSGKEVRRGQQLVEEVEEVEDEEEG